MLDRRSFLVLGSTAAVAGLAGCAAKTGAAAVAEANSIVDKANGSLNAFLADPDTAWFKGEAAKVKGMMIVPSLTRGGFIFGGSGGTGVIVARRQGGRGWSYPSFHGIGSLTVGFQIGGEISELMLLFMTDNALDAMLSPNIRVGGDVSVAAGPVGQGAKAQVADILAYSRSKGLYAGINLEGAGINARTDLNEAYYARPGIRPRDILVSGSVNNPQAEGLRRTLSGL